MSETKPGMSSLNEDDMRRVFREEMEYFMQSSCYMGASGDIVISPAQYRTWLFEQQDTNEDPAGSDEVQAESAGSVDSVTAD